FDRQWRATIAGRPADVAPTADGLIDVALPPGLHGPADVLLTWTLGARRTLGSWATAVGLACRVVLALGWPRSPRDAAAPPPAPAWAVAARVVGAAVVVAARWQAVDVERWAFGYAGGMTVTNTLDVLDVGAYGDTANGKQNFVVPAAWSAPVADGESAAR